MDLQRERTRYLAGQMDGGKEAQFWPEYEAELARLRLATERDCLRHTVSCSQCQNARQSSNGGWCRTGRELVDGASRLNATVKWGWSTQDIESLLDDALSFDQHIWRAQRTHWVAEGGGLIDSIPLKLRRDTRVPTTLKDVVAGAYSDRPFSFEIGVSGGDIEGHRAIVGGDAVTRDDLQAVRDALKEQKMDVTGEVNMIDRPAFGGETGYFLIGRHKESGDPFEVQVMTRHDAEKWDSSVGLRHVTRSLATALAAGMTTDPAQTAAELRAAVAQSRNYWAMARERLRAAREENWDLSPNLVRQDKLRNRVMGFITNPQYELRILSPLSDLEEEYLPIRMHYGAEPDIASCGIVGGPSAIELDEGIAKAGLLAPIYFPLVRPVASLAPK